jgi:hypothetical protein
MADSTEGPKPYRVVYSEVARSELRRAVEHAIRVARRDEMLAAIRKLDGFLRWVPEEGEPLADLVRESGHIRHVAVHPFVVQYAVYESSRVVAVMSPPKFLPNTGF